MRFLTTRVHGYLDYLLGIAMITSPWWLHFSDNAAAQWTIVAAGGLLLASSLCTRYELGVLRLLPMSSHLVLDFLMGAFLAASPWLLDFADQEHRPHLVFGILEMGAGLITKTTPATHNQKSAGQARGPYTA
jgi:hypothetical protein